MKDWKLGKIGNHEYGIVNLFIALTAVVVCISCLIYANAVAPLFAQVIFAITITGSLLILALIVWERIKKVEPSKKYEDERANMCSLKATRNAFITAMVFFALIMVIGDILSFSGNMTPAFGPLLAVWGVSVAVYTISWCIYIRAD